MRGIRNLAACGLLLFAGAAQAAASGAPAILPQAAGPTRALGATCEDARPDPQSDWRAVSIADLQRARRWLAAGETDWGAGLAPTAERARNGPNDADRAVRRQQVTVWTHCGLAAAERIGEPTARNPILGRLVETAFEAGAPPDASLMAAIAQLKSSGDLGDQAVAAALAGQAAFAAGDSGARGMVEQALLLEAERSEPLRLPDWYMLLSRIDPDARQQHIKDAYQALETVRPLLARYPRDPVTGESTFDLHTRPVFQAAIRVQLDGVRLTPAQVGQAQKIFEAYREAEIQPYFKDGCIPPIPEALELERLRPGEVILYPMLLDDRVELIYAAGDDTGEDRGKYHRLEPNRTSRSTVQNWVDQLQKGITAGDNSWKEPSQNLYALLIRPIEKHFHGEQANVAIIPDSALRAVPFAALTDKPGAFLIQKTAISIAPTLSHSQAPGPDKAGRTDFIIGAAVARDQVLQGKIFPQLGLTDNEVTDAVYQDHVSHGLVLDTFTRGALADNLKKTHANELHFATHAYFGGSADESFIVADGEIITLDDLRKIVTENSLRGGSLDLLVLSACDTAIGDDQATMGLAGAAIESGSVSVLASLWEVHNDSTIALMRAFHENYRRGLSKSEALRRAQISMLSQPLYDWAPFTMIGGWR